MSLRIVYQDGAGVSVITPAPEYADQIEAVAQRDVPTGAAWRIMDDSELPTRDTRDRWAWTESGPLAIAEG